VSIRADTCGAPHDLLDHPRSLRSSPTLPNQSRETQSVGRIRLKTKFRVILFRSSSVSIPIAPLQDKRCQLSAPDRALSDLVSLARSAFEPTAPTVAATMRYDAHCSSNPRRLRRFRVSPRPPDLRLGGATSTEIILSSSCIHLCFLCVLILHFQIHKFCGLLNA
jgi:hypothetical protein